MVSATVTEITPSLGWLLKSSLDNERDEDYAHMVVAPGAEPKPVVELEKSVLL